MEFSIFLEKLFITVSSVWYLLFLAHAGPSVVDYSSCGVWVSPLLVLSLVVAHGLGCFTVGGISRTEDGAACPQH